MRAIQTRYAGPTDYKGARVIAQCDAGRAVVPWDHELNADGNHLAAADALVKKLGWQGTLRIIASGELRDGSRAHVLGFVRP